MAVVFDIDVTLYNYDDAHGTACQALKAHARESFAMPPEDFDELHRLGSTLLEEHSGGRRSAIHDRLSRCQLTLERSGLPVRHAPVMAEFDWKALLDAMVPFSSVKEVLGALKYNGLRLGVGTNMTADRQFSRLEKLGFLDLMDLMVTSETISAEKPDRWLFDHCMKKAGCRHGDCAFVGDSLKGNA